MYELLTSEVPFPGENFVAVAMRHINEEPPLVRATSAPATCRREIEAAIQKAMAKRPEGPASRRWRRSATSSKRASRELPSQRGATQSVARSPPPDGPRPQHRRPSADAISHPGRLLAALCRSSPRRGRQLPTSHPSSRAQRLGSRRRRDVEGAAGGSASRSTTVKASTRTGRRRRARFRGAGRATDGERDHVLADRRLIARRPGARQAWRRSSSWTPAPPCSSTGSGSRPRRPG